MDFAENLKKYERVKTISIAFPSSIFDNTPTPQLEAYLVGQIARAAVVFNVTEIVIFDEGSHCNSDGKQPVNRDPNRIDRLIKLFEYAECPQYLRKNIFRVEPDLKYAGLINPLEAQHHLRTSQLDCPYREGVTTKHVNLESKQQQEWTEVNIGLYQPVHIPGHQELHNRVTVKVDPHDLKKIQSMLGPAMIDRFEAVLVSPVEPMEKLNHYWGYYVRKANSLTQAMKDNVFSPGTKNFYDLIIGTSERGTCIDEINFKKHSALDDLSVKKSRKEFRHTLVVFGGVRGLEYSASCDKELGTHENTHELFDYYINTCPNQGSNTIRTEEAILITMSSLRPKLNI